MKKTFSAFLLAIVLIISVCVPTFATEVKDVEVNLPEINANLVVDQATLKTLNKDSLKATIDGKELTINNVTHDNTSTDWIIFIDTSKSISKNHFDASKNAIVSLYNNLGENDTFVLYTFDVNITNVLNGKESKEEAVKKIKAIKAEGQDTVFYDVLSKMVDIADKSNGDIVNPIVYSDGKDTISKMTKEEISAKIKNSKNPIYGLYPDVTTKDSTKDFNEMLKISGGYAAGFSVKNAVDKLNKYLADNTVAVSMTINEAIAANEEANLKFVIGEGTVVTKNINVPEYDPNATTTIEASEEESTIAPAEPEKGFNITFVLIPVVVILVAVVVFVLLKKKKENNIEDNAEETTNDEITENTGSDENIDSSVDTKEKKKAKKKEKKEEPAVQFYFVDKK